MKVKRTTASIVHMAIRNLLKIGTQVPWGFAHAYLEDVIKLKETDTIWNRKP